MKLHNFYENFQRFTIYGEANILKIKKAFLGGKSIKLKNEAKHIDKKINISKLLNIFRKVYE